METQATRTKQDDCLLCRKNKATATNSHIYTKFITQSMFGDKSAKQGGLIDTGKFEYGEPINDTAKENYLLCPYCENTRLGRLETYIATFFYNRYRNEKFIEKFPLQKWYNLVTKELNCIRCDGVHNGMFKLFIYSLVWRASIANERGYKNFKLDSNIEEILRNILDLFLKETASETIDFYETNKDSFAQFQFNIVTPLNQKEATGNLVTEPNNVGNGSYVLFVNEFMIVFHTKWSYWTKSERSFNPGPYPIHIGVVDEGQWEGVVRRMAGIAVDAYYDKYKKELGVRKPKGFNPKK